MKPFLKAIALLALSDSAYADIPKGYKGNVDAMSAVFECIEWVALAKMDADFNRLSSISRSLSGWRNQAQ